MKRNEALACAVTRAIEMLQVAGWHCDQYASGETTYYDEAECDGTCIRADCESAISELQGATREIQWLPIESAPEDGTQLLLWARPNKRTDAAYAPWIGSYVGGGFTEGWEADDSGRWLAPTHWQHLPGPPP